MKLTLRNPLEKPRFRLLPPPRYSARVLPWVIAIMALLMTLALAFSLALHRGTADWSSDLAQKATVMIVEADDQRRGQQLRKALALLAEYPGIIAVREVPAEETQSLLIPWLGGAAGVDLLPIPALIDLTFSDQVETDLDLLRVRLGAVAPQAALDNHADWLADLGALTGSLQIISVIIVLLIATATAAVVAFSTRSSLSSHRESIDVLHLIGAEDSMIADDLQHRFFKDGLKGGLIGLMSGILIIVLVGWIVGDLSGGLLGAMGLPWYGWILLAALPVIAGYFTMGVARLTVHRVLQELT